MLVESLELFYLLGNVEGAFILRLAYHGEDAGIEAFFHQLVGRNPKDLQEAG